MKQLYANVPVLDTGARGSTTTFAQRGIGDVLLAWENEAFLAIEELGADKFDIVVPSLSIKAEPTVAVVDKVVDAKGTRKVAEAYLNFLYTPEAQKLIAHHYYRPSDPKSADPKDAGALRRREARADRRSAVRRMGQGAAEALRRGRHLRPDLSAQIDELELKRNGRRPRPGVEAAERHPGFRVGARFHFDLSVADRPHPARCA